MVLSNNLLLIARKVLGYMNLLEILEDRPCMVFVKGKTKYLNTMTSKSIRLNRADYDPVLVYKVGLVLSPGENDTWLCNLCKVQCVNLKKCIFSQLFIPLHIPKNDHSDMD